MNNKGFAITTILYGTLILFMLLLISMLGILAAYKRNMEKLIDASNGENGTRNIAIIEKKTVDDENNVFTSEEEIINYINTTNSGGLYCYTSALETVCKYYSSTTE